MLLYLLAACSAPRDVELLDHGSWVFDGCAQTSASVEAGALELDTSACSPIVVTGTLIEPVEAGDRVEIVWWHDFLYAEEPATGFFSLYLDGELLYRVARPIPGPPLATTEAFDAPVGGQAITVEVSNHGDNTWDLLRLTLNPTEEL